MRRIVICLSVLVGSQAVALWQETPIPTIINGYSIKSMALGNKNFIWALGFNNKQDSALFRWDAAGKAWRGIDKNLEHVEAIAASSNNLLFALQKRDDLVFLQAWNDSAWQEMYSIEHAPIGAVAAVDQKQVYVIVNGKPYLISGNSWRQLETKEGFREISASSDGTVYARRFNLEAGLLELMKWDSKTNTWQKQDVSIPNKEHGVMSIAVQSNNKIWVIIREDAVTGRAYLWNSEHKALELQGNQADFYTIAAASDGTVWALSGLPGASDRKIYAWIEKSEVPAQTPVPQTAQATQTSQAPVQTTQQALQVPVQASGQGAQAQQPAQAPSVPGQTQQVSQAPGQVSVAQSRTG